MIDLVVSHPHFWDHTKPVWEALGDNQGTLYAPRYLMRNGAEWPPNREVNLTLCSSIGDAKMIRSKHRPVAYLTHGMGQSYIGRHESYPGGRDRGMINLCLTTNEITAKEQQRFYPDVPAIVVGTPKMDKWYLQPPKPMGEPPLIVISFHWECNVAQEAKGALKYYKDIFVTLKRHFNIMGHSHPRIAGDAAKAFKQVGIPFINTFDEVLEKADVYICDNSSTIYEFASLNRPVVVLNAPWYRRNVNHGMRFWEFADVGYQCNFPERLVETIFKACEDPIEIRQRRMEIIEQVYPYRDGKSTQRAVEALVAVC